MTNSRLILLLMLLLPQLLLLLLLVHNQNVNRNNPATTTATTATFLPAIELLCQGELPCLPIISGSEQFLLIAAR